MRIKYSFDFFQSCNDSFRDLYSVVDFVLNTNITMFYEIYLYYIYGIRQYISLFLKRIAHSMFFLIEP